MKLKKIASLMLAGVMSVSMLAGCSGKGTTDPENPDDPIVVPETGIVAAVNNGQNADNDVKIDFTSNASLDAALASAVKAYGEDPQAEDLTNRVAAIMNITPWMNNLQWVYNGMENKSYVAGEILWYGHYNEAEDDADGDVMKRVEVFTIDSNNALNENAAMEKAAKTVNDKIATMNATSYEKGTTVSGQKYCDYSYSGDVSMVSVVDAHGVTTYCFAYTITQTTSVKTLAPQA